MRTFSKFAFLCLAIALSITLAGCAQKSSFPDLANIKTDQDTSTGSFDEDSQTGAIQSFSSVAEVELPDSPALDVEKEIQPIIKKIFGDLKVTGYSSDVYGAGSMLVEYTPSQKPIPSALPNFSKALKDKGYTVSMEHVDSNVGTAMYEGSKYTITATITTAKPIVGVSYIGK